MVKNLFYSKTDKLFIQLFRYIFVAGFGFLVDFGTLFFCTEWLKVHYLLSAFVAFVLGLITNYYLSIIWVFNYRTLENKWLEFGVFAFIGIIGLGLNEIIMWFFTENVGVYYLFSKIVSTSIVFFWNFFARKYSLTFRRIS